MWVNGLCGAKTFPTVRNHNLSCSEPINALEARHDNQTNAD
jgi:hypothetical protein